MLSSIPFYMLSARRVFPRPSPFPPEVHGQLYVLDLLDDPGALYEAGSAKAEEYYRQVNVWATSTYNTMPPSVQLPELSTEDCQPLFPSSRIVFKTPRFEYLFRCL